MTNEQFIAANACFCTKCQSFYFTAGTCNCYTIATGGVRLNEWHHIRYCTTCGNYHQEGTSCGTAGSSTVYGVKQCTKCGSFYFGEPHSCGTYMTYTTNGKK